MMIVTPRLNDRLTFFAGVNTGFVSNGQPDHRFIEFYRQRSSPALHCAIVGNVVVPGGHGSNRSTPEITHDPVWADVAGAIQSAGSLPGIQLATAWAGFEGTRRFVAKDMRAVIEQSRQLVKALGRDGIELTMAAFDAGVEIAVAQGFRHIQIHAAHGYLPSLLIDERITPDAGHVRDRFSRLADRLRAQGVETSIRMSIRTGDPHFDSCGAEAFQDAVASMPYDFIDLSSGFYNIDKRLIYPALRDVLIARHKECAEIAERNYPRRFIISGRINEAHAEFPANVDFGICRDLIANPRALIEPGNGCRDHGKCHYHSRGAAHVTCPRWAETGGDSAQSR